jgi:uncharacterized membrane protein YdfJ with MMPL/SSD domain
MTDSDRFITISLACALLLLLFMFGSFITAAIPLVSAIFSVGAGLSVVGLLASVTTFPTTAPTVATLLGLGVAVDYGLFLTARHREQLDDGMDVVSPHPGPRARRARRSLSPAARLSSRSSASTSPACRSSARWASRRPSSWPSPCARP